MFIRVVLKPGRVPRKSGRTDLAPCDKNVCYGKYLRERAWSFLKIVLNSEVKGQGKQGVE